MSTSSPVVGLTATAVHEVGDADTAQAVGSGALPVLATPTLLAWLEGASCAAVADQLPPGSSSVGTRLTLDHVRASPVGASVSCRADLVHVDGRLLRFEIVALAADGQVVAQGELTRVVVDELRFIARVST